MAAEEDKPEEIQGEGVDLPKKKISGKKLLLFVILGVVIAGGGLGAALFFTGVLGGSATSEEHKTEGETAEHATENAEPALPVFYEVPSMIVDLQSAGKRPARLRLTVSLQLEKEEDKAAVEAGLPRVIDSFQFYVRGLSREEIEGSAGLERLREELLLRVSAALAPVKIKDVLFTEIVLG